ncbi:Protein of unknown function (DUF2782) [Mariprofundus ferrinatatus]|uniref:DUF2782 domain-containing protein n=1 Tax=Mariprofundus ferrinatatus TaxID=1921087 RepID=A0A2K8LAS9_9PROT|nr:DUF2782 domain-containing protein [Mariprofundus ferrinatatus]ATX83001.1 Protein of unknown function (DUF2782) [Mariprofundus ferrinatatus]
MMMRYLLLPVSLFLMLSSSALAEEHDVPPPPDSSAAESTPPAENTGLQESAPNLQDELAAPDSDVAVDVRSYQRNDGATITEYAVHGRVYKIKVQPAGDLPAYYLYDPNGDGNFEQRLPGGGKRLSVPNWVLKEF